MWNKRWTAWICLIPAKISPSSSSSHSRLKYPLHPSPWGLRPTKVKVHLYFYKNCLRNKFPLKLTSQVAVCTCTGAVSYFWHAPDRCTLASPILWLWPTGLGWNLARCNLDAISITSIKAAFVKVVSNLIALPHKWKKISHIPVSLIGMCHIARTWLIVMTITIRGK